MPESLLENAKLSICLGIEDFFDKRNGRKLSAIRNLYAGVLLLLKEKLRELSPDDSHEVLLKQKITIKPIAGGGLSYIGKGKKTVNYDGIVERFKELNIIVDFSRIEKIREIRNNLEHYYTVIDNQIVSDVFNKAVIVINPFLKKELGHNPKDFFGEDYFNKIIEIANMNSEDRKKYCEQIEAVEYIEEELKEILTGDFCCPNCRVEKLFIVEGTEIEDLKFKCLACGNEFALKDKIDDILEDHYWVENYIRCKDAGEDSINQTCPECLKQSYNVEIDKCIFCGYERRYRICILCGNSLGVDEQDLGGLCSYCKNLMEKE